MNSRVSYGAGTLGQAGDLCGRSEIFSCLTFDESTICYRSWILFPSERLHFKWLMASRIPLVYQPISDFLFSFLSPFLIGRGHHHWLQGQLDVLFTTLLFSLLLCLGATMLHFSLWRTNYSLVPFSVGLSKASINMEGSALVPLGNVRVVRHLPHLTCRFLFGRTTNFHIILSCRISVPFFL